MGRSWSWFWAAASATWLVVLIAEQRWFLASLAAMSLVGAVLELRRPTPADRAADDAAATADWPVARIRELAGEHGIDPGEERTRIRLVRELRRADQRFTLLGAKQAVDRVAAEPEQG